MIIVVTGASGFIGPPLVRGLADAGHVGTALSRAWASSKRPPANWKNALRADVLESSGGMVDAIIHLEVMQHIQNPTPEDLRQFQRVNVDGTQEWLDWASRNQVKRFVFFSSIKAVADSSGCQDETQGLSPTTPYGKSKRGAEERVTAWAAESSARSALIIRPAVVYGPGNQANMLSLVDAISRNRYFLIGNNDNVKSLVSVRNLVAAVIHLLSWNESGAHLFYLTDEKSFSVAQIAGMIGEILNLGRPIRKLPLPLARVASLVGDCIVRVTGRSFPLTTSRLRALTETTHFSCAKLRASGFAHPQTTREGLEEMVNWYLATRGDVR